MALAAMLYVSGPTLARLEELKVMETKPKSEDLKPPLVLIPTKTLSSWQDWQEQSGGVLKVVERISQCPVYEVRLQAARQLRQITISDQAAAEEVQRLHRAISANGEGKLGDLVLLSYLEAAQGVALPLAVEYALNYSDFPEARRFSGQICFKLVCQWHEPEKLFTAMPSVPRYLEYVFGSLDAKSRVRHPDYVSIYPEPWWVDARRAMRVLVSFPTVSGLFLAQLEKTRSLMERGLIKLSDSVRGGRDSHKIQALHLVEISYTITKLRGEVWMPPTVNV